MMYRHINVHPQDKDLQSFLWRYSSDEPIQEYNLTNVKFGTSSAKYLTTRCPKKLADGNTCQHPRAAQMLSNAFMSIIYEVASQPQEMQLSCNKKYQLCFEQQDLF